MQDGIVRDNCFNNTFSLAEHFEGKGIDKGSPLYIASSWKEASTDLIKKVTEQAVLVTPCDWLVVLNQQNKLT